MTGNEPFKGDGPQARLLDYWRWSGSSLLDNTARGMLAEFLVATALGLQGTPRVEWDRYDLQAKDRSAIEVKSAAYIQTWKQEAPSVTEYRIARRRGWNPDTGEYDQGPKRRHADVYVFCLLEGADPIDVDHWQFFVISTAVLDARCGAQQTIRLSTLKRLWPRECDYQGLRKAVKQTSRKSQDPTP